MKAEELRIGNLVERDGNILEVVRIAKDGTINYELFEKAKGQQVNSGIVSPIPLTEEWLLKFNFEPVYLPIESKELKRENIERVKKGLKIKIVYSSEISFFRFVTNKVIILKNAYNHEFVVKFSKDLIIPIQHVHRLQNLVYELTNKSRIMKLQQGNYVLLDGTKEVEVIWQKNEKVCIIKVGETYPSAIVDLDRLNGLPINEEKLLKMGFKDTKESEFIDWFALDNFEITANPQVYIVYKDLVLKHINYIHRLQNLVYELTDKWLTL